MHLETLISLPAWLVPLGSFIGNYPYLFLSVGLLLGGETVLLPALYLGITGSLNLLYVFLIMTIATVLSDTFWYLLGRGAVPHILKIRFREKIHAYGSAFHGAVKGRELFLLFFSKFVYGTRIAAQVLCGLHKVPFWRYFFVNLAAVIALACVYTIIVYVAIELSYNVQSLVSKVTAFLTILGASMVGLHFIFRSLLRRT